MEKVLSYNELDNKKNQAIKELLEISFEYMVCLICQNYSDRNNIRFTDFNKKNNLYFTKLISFPFFVALSNGHSKSLYSLFGSFFSLSFGPASMDIFQLILESKGNGNFKYFNFLTDDVSGVQIKNLENLRDWTDIKTGLKELEINFEDGGKQFKNIFINSDTNSKKELFLAIESGVNAVNTQSNGNFFSADLDAITLQASYFKILKPNESNHSKLIKFDDVGPIRTRPYYLTIED